MNNPRIVILQRVNSEQYLLIAQDELHTLSFPLTNEDALDIERYLNAGNNEEDITLENEGNILVLQPEKGNLYFTINHSGMNVFRTIFVNAKPKSVYT